MSNTENFNSLNSENDDDLSGEYKNSGKSGMLSNMLNIMILGAAAFLQVAFRCIYVLFAYVVAFLMILGIFYSQFVYGRSYEFAGVVSGNVEELYSAVNSFIFLLLLIFFFFKRIADMPYRYPYELYKKEYDNLLYSPLFKAVLRFLFDALISLFFYKCFTSIGGNAQFELFCDYNFVLCVSLMSGATILFKDLPQFLVDYYEFRREIEAVDVFIKNDFHS